MDHSRAVSSPRLQDFRGKRTGSFGSAVAYWPVSIAAEFQVTNAVEICCCVSGFPSIIRSHAAEKPIRNDECAVGAVYSLRLRAVALALRGPPHFVDSLKNGRSQSAPTVARFDFFSSLLEGVY